ncbi:hypothetical protein [Amycolatopsis sp. NPDC102389]|uniref:hypothetical protein n=1 Tax=Amycolatopsis sp. NPDC102389 TaxID=3363941 RepID=UPI00382A44BB
MNDEYADSWQEKKPPMAILLLAVLSVAGSYILLLFGDFGSHLSGYLLGSVVCAGLIAIFMKVDMNRRTAPDAVYLASTSARFGWSAVLLGGIGASGAHAWSIATELAVR